MSDADNLTSFALSAYFAGGRLECHSVSPVGLCQQLWQKGRILPGIVTEKDTNCDTEVCRPFQINTGNFAYSDILHCRFGWSYDFSGCAGSEQSIAPYRRILRLRWSSRVAACRSRRLLRRFLVSLCALLARFFLGSLGRSLHFGFGLGQRASQLGVALDVACQVLSQFRIELLRSSGVTQRCSERRVLVLLRLWNDANPKGLLVLAGHGDHDGATREHGHQFNKHAVSFRSWFNFTFRLSDRACLVHVGFLIWD